MTGLQVGSLWEDYYYCLVCACVWVNLVCTPMWGLETDLGNLSLTTSTLYCEAGFLTEPRACDMVSPASQLALGNSTL